MDRLDELAIFVGIIDAGSLAGAARRQRRSAPAVTRALAALEDRVGVRLVERSTRRLSPTEAGRSLAERARVLLADYEMAVRGEPDAPVAGLLRITAPVQFGRRHVAPIVTEFLDLFPDVQVELMLNDRNLDLIEEGLDVAVRIGALADSRLVARRVGSVRRLLVASPAYLARHGTPKRPADLNRHETIFNLLQASATAAEWRFGEQDAKQMVRLSPRLLVDDVETKLQAVRAGRGIARVLSYQVGDELAAGTLVRLLPDFEPEAVPVNLIILSRNHIAPKVRAFLDHAAQSFREAGVIRCFKNA